MFYIMGNVTSKQTVMYSYLLAQDFSLPFLIVSTVKNAFPQ